MKIAVISDIHGNMQALDAVLEDIEKENCQKIYCLGDLAMAGPDPIATIDKIKWMENDGKIEVIQGNTDEMIGYGDVVEIVKAKFPVMGNALEDDVAIIPPDLKEYLKNLPKQKEIEIEGVKILLVHGSPRKNDENIFPKMRIEKIEHIIDEVDANLILCGHTHIPCGYQTRDRKTLINVGSVGRPLTKDTKSCYLTIEIANGDYRVEHRFVKYNKQKASEILSKRGFKGAEQMSKMLTNPDLRHI